MSGVPTEEQLRRIEAGVRARIDRRRRVAQRVAGASAAVVAFGLVLGGGAAILPHLASGAGGGSSAGSAADSSAVVVTCHGPRGTTRVRADATGLPDSALAACATVLARGVRPDSTQGGSPSVSPAALGVLCRATDGDLHVLPAGTTCRDAGMGPVGDRPDPRRM